MSPLLKQVTGDCDCCDSVNIVITMRHDMKMCDDCIAKEDAVVPTIQSVDALIQQSRKMDDAIQLKQDVFNATSVAAIEIHAAIMNDPSIPDDQKDFMVVKELFRRQQHLQEVLFNERQSILQHAFLLLSPIGIEVFPFFRPAQNMVAREERFSDAFAEIPISVV